MRNDDWKRRGRDRPRTPAPVQVMAGTAIAEPCNAPDITSFSSPARVDICTIDPLPSTSASSGKRPKRSNATAIVRRPYQMIGRSACHTVRIVGKQSQSLLISVVQIIILRR
mmetsp:Transcript_31976/g.54560  ORF Transcript_31976/g.54560 Transcript_31976/m.54560 type:complete len:112 (-) Transcript_31976:780-1115(-)